jgi:hypothetical protein
VTYSALIEVPGARPTTFKLVEWAPDSFHLFRSSRKIGAVVKERGWSAKFRQAKKEWTAKADSAEALLKLVGTFILASEARDLAARPVEEAPKGKRPKGKDEKISLEFLKRAQELRLAGIDAVIEDCRRRIVPA